jgi:hypothetical protein
VQEEGDQMRWWELAREFIMQTSAAHGGQVRAVFPDAGGAAMLKNRWGAVRALATRLPSLTRPSRVRSLALPRWLRACMITSACRIRSAPMQAEALISPADLSPYNG